MIEGVRVIAEHMAVAHAYATALDDDDVARFEKLERGVCPLPRRSGRRGWRHWP